LHFNRRRFIFDFLLDGVQILVGTKDSSLLQNIKIGSGVQEPFYSTDNIGFFLGVKASRAWWWPIISSPYLL